MNKKTWKEFRESGLLWFTNSILHMFGWSIVVDIDDNGDVTNAYPARVKFRGFSENTNTSGYKKVTHNIAENIEELLKEVDE